MAENKCTNANEFEELSQQELDSVSGGTATQLMEDSVVLASMGYGKAVVRRPSSHALAFDHNAIIKSWADAGVEVRYDNFYGNKYFIDGKQVSRESALAYVKNKG